MLRIFHSPIVYRHVLVITRTDESDTDTYTDSSLFIAIHSISVEGSTTGTSAIFELEGRNRNDRNRFRGILVTDISRLDFFASFCCLVSGNLVYGYGTTRLATSFSSTITHHITTSCGFEEQHHIYCSRWVRR
jgi:hypothetical protein